MSETRLPPRAGNEGLTWRVDQVIDRQPVSRLQWLVMGLCAVVTVLDGFDAQAIGFLASPIADQFQIDVRSFGPVFALGLVGIMFGSLIMGPVGDQVGRKWTLVVSVIVIGVCSGLTVFARSLHELMLLRFLTGLGLGGAMPCALALAAEYMPARLRPAAVCSLAASIPVGGMVAGLAGSVLLPRWGWPSLFFIGGVAPLAMAVVLAFVLPESVRFLSLTETNQGRVAAIMGRIWPEGARPGARFVTLSQPAPRFALRELFTEGRAAVTVLLWTAYFMNLLVLYVVVSWLPALLRTAGLPVSAGAVAIACFSLGGIAGSVSQAALMTKFKPVVVLSCEFAIFAVLIEYLAFSTLTTLLVGVVAVGIGWVIQGAQAGLNVFSATFYPTAVRATGIGWGLGIGRIGSICGPLLGGAALMDGWSAREILAAGAIPAICAAAAIAVSGIYGISRLASSEDLGSAAQGRTPLPLNKGRA